MKSEAYGVHGTESKSSTSSRMLDDYERAISSPSGKEKSSSVKVEKAVPEADTKAAVNGGVKKFTVKLLPENGRQRVKEVLCVVGLDSINFLDPGTSQSLRKYALEDVASFQKYDPSTFAFWSKTEQRHIRLLSDSYTTNAILDTVTTATVQMSQRNAKANVEASKKGQAVIDGEIWSKEHINNFCDICVKYAAMRMCSTAHFDEETWTYIVNEFNEITGLCYSKLKLKDKWDRLCRVYEAWLELKTSASGLGWDSTSNMNAVNANQEWQDRKAKENEKLEQFGIRGIDEALELKYDSMFKDTNFSLDYAWSPNSGVLCDSIGARIEADIELYDEEDDSDDSSISDAAAEIGCPLGATPAGNASMKMKTASLEGRGKQKKKEGCDRISGQIERMLSAFEKTTSVSSERKRSGTSVSEVINMLENMKGVKVGGELHIKAITLLTCGRDSVNKREAFVAMKPEIRLPWLRSLFPLKIESS